MICMHICEQDKQAGAILSQRQYSQCGPELSEEHNG